jgi:hypothetical protein
VSVFVPRWSSKFSVGRANALTEGDGNILSAFVSTSDQGVASFAVADGAAAVVATAAASHLLELSRQRATTRQAPSLATVKKATTSPWSHKCDSSKPASRRRQRE